MNTAQEHISETFLSSLASQLPGVFYCSSNDEEFSLLYISNNCKDLTGYTDHELLEYGLLFLVHLEDRHLFKKTKEFHKSKNESFKIEYRIVSKNGQTKWVSQISKPVFNELGQLMHIEGHLSELLEKYQLSTLSQTFYSLQNAVNKSSLVTITNKQGEISYANELFCKSMQYNVKELIGNDHRLINSGIHTTAFFKDLWKTILRGEIWRGEICNRSKGGSLLWYDTIITPLFDKKNETVQFLSIRNNITDKKMFETVIKKNEEQLRKVFENANDIIYTISQEGNILTLNNAFERITNWKTEDWIGQPFSQLIHPDDLVILESTLAKLFMNEQVPTYEVRIRVRNGNYIYAEQTSSALSENGTIVATLGIARNITDRKQSELKLKQIYKSISVKTGMNYFSNLTKYCCDHFKVKFAAIGVFNETENSLQMLSFRVKGLETDNYKIDVINTPYERVLRLEGFVFNGTLKTRFPNDPFIVKNRIESFIGFPLIDENDKVLGVIALMDTNIIHDVDDKENFMSYVLSRTANEIRRDAIEKKLKESETFNKGVLASLSSHIAVIDEKGVIISANEAWTNFALENGGTDLPRSGVGSNYFEVCEKAIKNGDEVARKALDGIRSVLLKLSKTFQLEYPCNSPKQLKWFLLNVSLYESGTPKVVLRHVDITERKQFDRILKISERNYRELIENSTELIFRVDNNSKITFSNKYFQKVLSLSSDDLKELTLIDIVHPDYHLVCEQHIKEVLAGNMQFSVELVFLTKSKKKIYVEGNSSSIIISSKVTGVQSFFRDITERKKLELEFIKSERRYKNVVENINDGIVVRNLKGKIIFSNQQFLDLLGKTGLDAEIIDDNYIADGWKAEVKKLYSNFPKHGSGEEIHEYQGMHDDGSLVWLEDRITLLFDDGRKTGIQSVIRNITNIKKKESELKKLINELTNRNNEMMQFNYIISHNLRAPIANIIGLCNIISNENVNDDERQNIIQHIRSSSIKVDDIIKDLSLVLNTRSNLNAKKEKINLKKVVTGILETLEDQLSLSQCKFEIDIAPSANENYSIKSYIESILYNLISNSIKYRSNERQLKVTLRIEKVLDGIRITVADNGIGINLIENGAYMFGLYKRFNYEVEGKGLGLHMTKTQVESLNGKINVLSELNKGATFIINFPDV
ncbi:MAG: PAS domain S-box protein [bacterium]|nr:PAS domain S-box protein [bacterium]